MRSYCTISLFQTTLAVAAILSGDLAQLVDSYSTGGWLYYGLVFGGLLIMRVTHRKIKRAYKVESIVHTRLLIGKLSLGFKYCPEETKYFVI